MLKQLGVSDKEDQSGELELFRRKPTELVSCACVYACVHMCMYHICCLKLQYAVRFIVIK